MSGQGFLEGISLQEGKDRAVDAAAWTQRPEGYPDRSLERSPVTAGGRRRRTPAWHPEPDTEPAAPAGSPNPPRSMVLGSLCGAGRGRQGPEKKRIEALLV